MLDTSWEFVKNIVDTHDSLVQYTENGGTSYLIWTSHDLFTVSCNILKDGGADQTDFETNYKPTANQSPYLDFIKKSTLSTSNTFTANGQTFDVPCAGAGAIRFELLGTWLGNVQWSASIDGVNFTLFYFARNTSTGFEEGSSLVNGLWVGSAAGFQTIRFETIAWTSGTATLNISTINQGTIIEDVLGTVGIAGNVRLETADEVPLNAGQQLMVNSLPIVIASDQTAIPITGSISATNPSVSTTGSAVPADATMIGGSDGTNLKAVKVSTAGVVSVDASGVAVPVTDNGGSLTVDNGGIFAVQATLSAETTKVIGTVNIAASQTIGLSSGAAVIGHVINDASSAVIGHVIVDTAPSTAVTNAGTFAVQATVAASATNIAKAEDVASADADVGVPAMAIRKATPANTSGTDGDYEMLQISAGRLWTSAVIDTALPAGTNAIGKLSANSGVIIGDVNVVNTNVSTNVAQVNGVTTSVGNGVSGTGVQRVTIASDSTGQIALASGSNTIGALTANQSINNAQIAGVTTSVGNGTSGTGVQRVAIASDNTAFSVNATGPTLTKGTQGSTGYSTQALLDAGRTAIIFSATNIASGSTTTETAITLVKSSGTGATSSAASFVVTNGKRFRITGMVFATRGNLTATAQITTFNFRLNTAGAVTTSSTPVLLSARCATPATALAWDRVTFAIPDGYEILGDGTLQIGITANAVFTTNAPTWDVNIMGFEY